MYVLIEGQLWKFTKKHWTEFCHCSAVKGSCEDPTLFDAKPLQNYVAEIVDWTTQDFACALAAPPVAGEPL